MNFPSSRVNVRAILEFEIAYFEAVALLIIIWPTPSISSSPSWCVPRTDFPDSLSAFISIIYLFRLVSYTTSSVRTEMWSIISSWTSNTYSFVWRDPLKNVANEFVLTSLAVPCMSSPSYLDGFRDWRYVAVQPLFVGCCLASIWIQKQLSTCMLIKKETSPHEMVPPRKRLNKFTYLVSTISSTENDIDMWLAKAWIAINRLSIIWKSNLSD